MLRERGTNGVPVERLCCLGFVSSVCLASSLLWASGSAPRLDHQYPRVEGRSGVAVAVAAAAVVVVGVGLAICVLQIAIQFVTSNQQLKTCKLPVASHQLPVTQQEV